MTCKIHLYDFEPEHYGLAAICAKSFEAVATEEKTDAVYELNGYTIHCWATKAWNISVRFIK